MDVHEEDGWIEGWMDRWMMKIGGQMDGWIGG